MDYKALILIPKRNISDTIFKDSYIMIKDDLRYLDYVDLVFNLFYIGEFTMPLDKDLIIQYNIATGEYIFP